MASRPAVPTWGLTHVALAVRDPERSLRFYQHVLGVVPVYRDRAFIQVQTPGSRDVIVFERKSRKGKGSNGVLHFGFRLRRPGDIARACKAIVAAGGRIRDTGEFVPGEPYVFFEDLDGHLVEIWYELPTPVDPPSRSKRKQTGQVRKRGTPHRLRPASPRPRPRRR